MSRGVCLCVTWGLFERHLVYFEDISYLYWENINIVETCEN